jgi:nitroimidazol reductase NimA-like FMN-containing flavoprotein (pyridoxamine 5'-phosphate oxidase superfamily)
MKIVDRTGTQWIDRDECVKLLASDEIGRVAVVDGRTPVVFPVNYALDGEDVVFRTDPGTKTQAGPRACFEIDGFDRRNRAGWSVVVTGRLEEVTEFDGDALDRVKALSITPWAGGEKSRWMRIVPTHISGRRIGVDR